jgi:hypothetical protein
LLDFLIALAMVWLLAHLTHRYLIKEANVVVSVLVAFAFTLLAPILHLFLALFAAVLFDQSFDPESWFSHIPLLALSSAIIAYVTIKTNTQPANPDDDHIEKKM